MNPTLKTFLALMAAGAVMLALAMSGLVFYQGQMDRRAAIEAQHATPAPILDVPQTDQGDY